MESRTTRTTVTFSEPFALRGSDELLPAGVYDLIIEEERLQGLTFDAYRRTGAFLEIATNPRFPGRTELRPVSDADLQQARAHDAAHDAGHDTGHDTADDTGQETALDPDPAAGSGLHIGADRVPRKEIP